MNIAARHTSIAMRSSIHLVWLALVASCAVRGAAAADAAGIIVGRVTYEGEVPIAGIPDETGVRRPLVEVHPRGGGLQFVVVYLDVADDEATERTAVGNGARASDETPPKVDQIAYRFVPRVLAVREGQPVAFSNSDDANHNVRAASLDARNQFNTYTPAGGGYAHRFYADRKQRPIVLSCDLHAWMRGWVYVFRHAYFSVTDKEGRFELADVPPGEYRLVFKQPDVGWSVSREVTVENGKRSNVAVACRRADLKLPGP